MRPNRLWPTQPLILKDIECSFSRGRRSGNEADHTFPGISEIKNGWRHTSIDRYDFTFGKGKLLPLFKLSLEGQKKIMKNSQTDWS
jgi:hypothetical protein